MTQTMNAREIDYYAQVTLRHLDQEQPRSVALLALIEHSKQELDALAAGMHGQTGEARALQNRCWSAQHAAQLEMVQVALAEGVSSNAITAITWRES